MTIDRETVIRLAKESGALVESWMTNPPKPSLFYMSPEQLERFAALVLEHERKPLTDEQIERLREKMFSTNNPYCPVDRKSMRKAVRAAEIAHGITNKESSDAEPS